MEKEKINIEPGYWDFESISDFKQCMEWGGETEFEWKGKSYSITRDENGKICASEGCYEKEGKYYNVLSNTVFDPNDSLVADTSDEILEYIVGGDRLRDVITKVEVLYRTI